LTTVEISTTSLSTISLDQFGLKAYNFEVLHKYNGKFVTKIKLTESGITRVTRCQFLFIWYPVVWCYWWRSECAKSD